MLTANERSSISKVEQWIASGGGQAPTRAEESRKELDPAVIKSLLREGSTVAAPLQSSKRSNCAVPFTGLGGTPLQPSKIAKLPCEPWLHHREHALDVTNSMDKMSKNVWTDLQSPGKHLQVSTWQNFDPLSSCDRFLPFSCSLMCIVRTQDTPAQTFLIERHAIQDLDTHRVVTDIVDGFTALFQGPNTGAKTGAKVQTICSPLTNLANTATVLTWV